MARNERVTPEQLIQFAQELVKCEIGPTGRPIKCYGLIEDVSGNIASSACVQRCRIGSLGQAEPDPNQFSLFNDPDFQALLETDPDFQPPLGRDAS